MLKVTILVSFQAIAPEHTCEPFLCCTRANPDLSYASRRADCIRSKHSGRPPFIFSISALTLFLFLSPLFYPFYMPCRHSMRRLDQVQTPYIGLGNMHKLHLSSTRKGSTSFGAYLRRRCPSLCNPCRFDLLFDKEYSIKERKRNANRYILEVGCEDIFERTTSTRIRNLPKNIFGDDFLFQLL